MQEAETLTALVQRSENITSCFGVNLYQMVNLLNSMIIKVASIYITGQNLENSFWVAMQ